MKLGPESKRFIHLNPEKGNMINPLQRRGENPSSSKTQLKETVLKKPKPKMSTKFQIHAWQTLLAKLIQNFVLGQGQNDEESPGEISTKSLNFEEEEN